MNHNELYEKVCQPKLEEIASNVSEIRKVLISGNGYPPVLTRMAKVEQVVKAIVWFVGVIVVSLVGTAFAFVFKDIGKQ